MTYEKFCQKVLQLFKDDKDFTRKSVRKVTLRLLFMYLEVASLIGYLVGSVFSSLAILAGVAVFVALIIVTFDYISSDKEIFSKWAYASKFWWLSILLTIGLIILMSVTLR